MPPGMHSNMDAAGKQDVSRCEEDERTMSMLNLKDQAGELRSLYRTAREDEEVVFERSTGAATTAANNDNDGDDDGDIRRALSNSTASNATSTSSASVMNAWDHGGGVRDDEKKEEGLLIARHNQKKEEERAAAKDDNKKLIKRVNPASLSPKSQQAKTTTTPSNKSTSPSSQSSGSPPPLVSPGQQEQLQALARRKGGQHTVVATNHPSNGTTTQTQLKSPPNHMANDLTREEKDPSPAKHQFEDHMEQEGGVASSPKPGTLKAPPQHKMDQGAASPPNLRMEAAMASASGTRMHGNTASPPGILDVAVASSPARHRMDGYQDQFAPVASPSGSRHSNSNTASPKRPSLAASANTNQDHYTTVASPSGSRAPPKRPSLASSANSNTMGLTRQGGAHSLVQLQRQGAMHDLKPEQLPVQDNVPGFQSMHPHHNPQHPMPTRRPQPHQQGYSGGGSIASSDAQSRGASIGGRHGPATRPGIRNKIAAFGQRGLGRRQVDEKTKQLAAELNKQKRMKQKLQLQQPRAPIQQDDDGKLFPIVAKVPYNKQRRISDVSLDMESVGTGCARRRRSSVSEVHNDPVFNTVVSEPQNPIAPRSVLASQKREQELALARRGVNRNHSPQVMQNTATISHRTGLSSLTNEEAAVQEAVVKMQGRPGLVVTVDNLANSTHSSVGFNSASNRTLDVSAHLNASWPAPAKVPNSYHNYHSPLQPHLEGGSVSSANRSRTAALDATSVISPPTRDEFHRRRSSVRVPPDSASVASSRVSGVGAPRRRSRTSFTGGAGLRHGRPSVGGVNESVVRRSSKPGEAPIPSRTGMDAARYHIAQQMKQEGEKKTIEDWDDMLKFQDDVIIELACKLSKLDNEKQVQAQQQLHLHAGKDPATTAPSTAGNGPPLESTIALSDLTQYHHYYSDHGHGFVEENSQAAAQNESMQTAEYQAMLLAFEESQRDSHPKPELELEDDKALKIALEKSLIEAQENDKIRNARQLYSDLGESFPEIEPEKSAPWAPMEEGNVAQPSDAEVEKTMEVAKRLSIETHEFEISKKHAPPMEKNIHQVESCHSPRSGRNTLDSALQMEYNVSIQNDGPPRSPNVGDGVNDHMSAPNHSLVMPSELIEDDESVHRETLTPQAPTVDRDGDDGHEALLLAMALSKMDVAAANPNANVLSEDESLAFALAESRRTPGAHGSMGSSDSHQRPPPRQPQSSAGSFQDHFNTQDVYQGTQTPQHQFPDGLPFYQQGYHQPPQQFYPPQQFHPQMYPPQPYYAPPYYPPMHQPPPYQMPPYQPHLYPPQAYQAPAYPQFYHPPYQEPYNLPYQQPHNESRNVRSNPSASAGYFDNSPAAISSRNLVESEDDEAFKLALALSREDARDANNRKRETNSSEGSNTAPLISADDDGSLALALELSRMK